MPESSQAGDFYDDEVVFANYTRHRAWSANPNLVMEEPALLEVLGDVSGARVIDLGCGDAALGPRLLAAGCGSDAGFRIGRLSECAPGAELLNTDGSEFRRRQRIPLFLLLAGEKT